MKKIFLICTFLICNLFVYGQKIQVGAAQLGKYLHLLTNKKVALVVNHTAMIGDKHLLDLLLENKVNVVKVFAPEHGFRGNADAGEKINTEKDAQTGLPIISLYGKNYKPTPSQLTDIEVVIFDIQDVGLRFYTYISTLHYVMEACAENQKQLIVLDRPNPNGFYVDGFVRDKNMESFVGKHPIPVVHGLTVGELAQMINGEAWLEKGLRCPLQVIDCQGYSHKMKYSLPQRPSPNLPNDRSVELYASLCFFEGTDVSVGRGTEFPFQVAGSPDFSDKSFSFTPVSNFGAKSPMHQNKVCYGKDYRKNTDWKYNFSLKPIIDFYKDSKNKANFFNAFFDKLAGTPRLREMIIANKSEEEIRASWKDELEKYKKMRKKYLLYEDFD